MNEFIISFIIGGILLIWCIIFRFSENGKVEGEPLSMPRGTVRALVTLMLVTFPFGYIISGENVPGLVVNVIFIAVAFYFEARRSQREELREIINEIKNPELVQISVKKEKKPLYLPKFSVRILLIILLITFLVINWYGGASIALESTNTILDLMIIIALFIIGGIFRSIFKIREMKRIKEDIANMDASLSQAQIIEKLMLEPNWWKRTGKNILSIIVLIVVVIALLCYSFRWDYVITTLIGTYNITVIGLLLLLINAYYGFRD